MKILGKPLSKCE